MSHDKAPHKSTATLNLTPFLSFHDCKVPTKWHVITDTLSVRLVHLMLHFIHLVKSWSRDGNHEFTTCEWNALLSPAYLFSRGGELGMHESCSSSRVRKHEFTSWMECYSWHRELVISSSRVQWNAALHALSFQRTLYNVRAASSHAVHYNYPLCSHITCRAEGRPWRPDLRVVTDRSGEDDRTFTSDDKLERELLDLLRSIALAAVHSTTKLHEYTRTITTRRKLSNVLFLALSVTFLFVYEGTAQWICTKFTGRTCLVPYLDEFECQGQREKVKVTRDKKRHFSALSAACVQFVW